MHLHIHVRVHGKHISRLCTGLCAYFYIYARHNLGKAPWGIFFDAVIIGSIELSRRK